MGFEGQADVYDLWRRQQTQILFLDGIDFRL